MVASTRWARAARALAQTALFEAGAVPYAVLTTQPLWRTNGGRLAELAQLAPGEHVLDLGCGPGESAFGMADRISGLQVTGLDLSHAMVGLARARSSYDRAGHAVSLRQGNAERLPFADGTFDAVTGHSFLYLLPDARAVLREAARVVKPGRRLVFLEPAAAPRSALTDVVRTGAARGPRFTASMVLWRAVSRRYGRFDERRLCALFEEAGLEPVEAVPTLGELAIFGVAQRPVPTKVTDIAWERWKPKDDATLLFVVREGQVLLIRKKRGLGAGKVNAPGGRIEPGESPLEAAIRETREEVGVTPTGVRFAGEVSFQFCDGYALHAHVFTATDCEGEAIETDEAKPLWTLLDRIPFGEMWADDAHWLPHALAGRRFAGRFVFDGDAMVDMALDVTP